MFYEHYLETKLQVIKRDGTKENLDIEKLHKVIEWACGGISAVSVSEIELKSQIHFYSGIKTTDIHETMIKSASSLISEETPNYQYVAGRLISYQLRKQVYNSHIPDHLYERYTKVKNLGFYDSQLDDIYVEAEWNELNDYIDHERDNSLTYASMEQFRSKYLVKNRVTGEIFETPQIAFMLIAMKLFSTYTTNRTKWVKQLYDSLSTFDISLPTPIMAGVRTTRRQYSSCFLIESDDSLNSINATSSAIVKYVADKAGVGVSGGKIRGFGSPIRKGDAYHTGVIPFFKYFNSAVGSCNQGGIRRGSGTMNFMFWHYEVEDMLVLKNNKGTEETRIRDLDYCIHFNKLFYERFLSGGNISLFSPSEVPGLYDAFYRDPDEFKELYEKYERSKVRRKTISASDLFTSFIQERKDTGRIYFMNVDHANSHGSFLPEQAAIRMTNLCVEITLPTVPLNDVNDPMGRIALCILSALNWGKIKSSKDFEKPCELVVRLLDSLIDIQEYILPAAKNFTMDYRPLGIGIVNFAYFLAKNNANYSTPNLELVHEYAEAWSYYLIKASVELAKEKGPCRMSQHTKYAQGILPIDTYKKEVDELVAPVYKMDWESLRSELKKYGIRNATLMACMPAECQSLENKMTLKDDTIATLEEIILSGGVDIDYVHEQMMIGQRFALLKPVELKHSTAYECYYNGPAEVTLVEFEDGSSYEFTENHKLLVNKDGVELFLEIRDIVEGDYIVKK